MKKLRIILSLFALIGLFTAFVPVVETASAADLFKDTCATRNDSNNNPDQSTLCTDKNNSTNPVVGSNGVLLRISTIIASIAGVVAVIMVIIGGIGMITSGGDAAAVKTARSRMIHASIGLVIIVLAQTIISFVLGKILA